MLRNNFHAFRNRRERAQFIANNFSDYLKQSQTVLDVGCSENDLKKIVGNKVFGIDIADTPDKFVDLEKESLSAFTENSYDFVVCTEVLEHIDNLYEVFDDIVRVANKYILISLPNCPDIWKILKIILTSRTGKFYGLPEKKPRDRHKWFFSWKDLDDFFVCYCKKNNLQIKEKFLHYNYFDSFKGVFIKSFLKLFPIKSFAQSYWIVIKKQ